MVEGALQMETEQWGTGAVKGKWKGGLYLGRRKQNNTETEDKDEG